MFYKYFGETVVNFFNIDKISARETETVVDNYCKHIFNNPSYQSKQFKSDLRQPQSSATHWDKSN